MTDEQFQTLMQMQTAQLTLLQGCCAALEAMARNQGIKGAHHNWDTAQQFFDSALARVNPEEYERRRSQKT